MKRFPGIIYLLFLSVLVNAQTDTALTTPMNPDNVVPKRVAPETPVPPVTSVISPAPKFFRKTAEVQLNIPGTGTSTIVVPELRFRYFLKPSTALRIGFGLTKNKITQPITDLPDPLTGQTEHASEYQFKSTASLFKIGIEKHFLRSARFSPYFGLEARIGSTKQTDTYGKIKLANIQGEVPAYDQTGNFVDDSYRVERESGSSTLGMNFLLGFDYNIHSNIYLGTEFGLGYLKTNPKDLITVTNGDPIVANNKTSRSKGPEQAGWAVNNVAGIRLGWRF